MTNMYYSNMSFFNRIRSAVSSSIGAVTRATASVLSSVAQYLNPITPAQAIYQQSVQALPQQMALPPQPQPQPEPVIDLLDDREVTSLDGSPLDNLETILEAINKITLQNNEYAVVRLSFKGGVTRYLTIKQKNKKTIAKELRDMIDFVTDSDAEIIETSDDIAVVLKNYRELIGYNVSIYEPDRKARVGAFFKYTHRIGNSFTSNYLKTLGIYSTEYIQNNKATKEVYYNRCLIEAFRGQIPDDKFEQLKSIVKTDFVPKDKLPEIAKKLKICFKLYFPNSTTQRRMNTIFFGKSGERSKEDDKIPTICYIDEHFFRFDKITNITKFFIENHDKVPSLPKAHLVNTIKSSNQVGFCRIPENTLDSYELVNLLLKSELLTPLSIESIESHPEFKESEELNTKIDIENHCVAIQCKTSDKIKRFFVIDFETTTDGLNHQPYLVAIYGDHTDSRGTKSIVQETFSTLDDKPDIVKSLFNYIFGDLKIRTKWNNRLTLFAHNLTYDIGFLINHPSISKIEPLVCNGRMVACKFEFESHNAKLHIDMRDSLRIIPVKASSIPKMLGIQNVQKEVMIYELYNTDTVKNLEQIPMSTIEQYKSLPIYEDFINNLKLQKCIKSDNVDLLRYAQFYCIQDCRIVYEGLYKFNELFKLINPTMPDVWNFYSLPSIAMHYFYIEGCYEGCYQFSGLLGKYFSPQVIGGRCMLKDNQPQNIQADIQDFDAVSLYPSAMHYFNGFVRGTPEIIENFEPDNYNYYFIRVRVDSIKPRHFPVVSSMSQTTREWTNDLIGKIIPIDKVGLEDAIEFQDLKYTFIDGYYFDEGFNTRIKDVIKNITDRRQQAKEDKNEGLQQVLKLLANSSYGKLIQHTPDQNTRIITGFSELRRQMDKRYHYVKVIESIGVDYQNDSTKYILTEYKPVVESYSSPHLGCQILSYSKRLMNRVMCLAEDIGIEIYYQDTDSMHIKADDILPLSKAFKTKYSTDLIGKQLGQFHSDFNVEGLDSKSTISRHFIGFAKKCYIDKCEDASGKIGFHIRMKGVSPSAIDAYIEENKLQIMELYESHYQGNPHTYDLLANGKVSFEKNRAFEHSNRSKFTRTVGINIPEEIEVY